MVIRQHINFEHILNDFHGTALFMEKEEVFYNGGKWRTYLDTAIPFDYNDNDGEKMLTKAKAILAKFTIDHYFRSKNHLFQKRPGTFMQNLTHIKTGILRRLPTREKF